MQDMYQVSDPVALHAPPRLDVVLEGTQTFMQHRSSLYRDLHVLSEPVTTFNDGRLKMKAFTIKADPSHITVPPLEATGLGRHAHMMKKADVSAEIGAQFDHHAERPQVRACICV